MGNVPEQLKPYVFKKGNKFGKGRKPLKTLKEYAREYLARMPEEERLDFLNSLSREFIWQMAEGRPSQDMPSLDKALNILFDNSFSKKNNPKKNNPKKK